MNCNDKFLSILRKRWGDFYYVYVRSPDSEDELPSIPAEILDKFKLEISQYSKYWSPNDDVAIEIIDTIIRSYWQNNLLGKQARLNITIKIFTYLLSLFIITITILFVYSYNFTKKSQKNEFVNDLIQRKWCDEIIENENGGIECRIGKIRYAYIVD